MSEPVYLPPSKDLARKRRELGPATRAHTAPEFHGLEHARP